MRPSTDAEGARCLDEFQFAQFQGLGAQQAGQSGPAGETEDGAQGEQAHVAACRRRIEQFRMRFDLHLHHQHGSGDEQHAWNGIERGVHILDGIVDASAEITGGDAQAEGEGQHDQRRQTCR
jgi:hypothetical protein